MKALIGGTSLLDSSIFSNWEERRIETKYGTAEVRVEGDWVFLQRHGNPPLPPHRINHRANILGLWSLDVKKVISFNSTGSLKEELKPGMFLLPDDFFSPWSIPTFFDEEMHFIVPGMDNSLRNSLFRLCERLSVAAVNGGTYVQTIGPRLETRAEIRVLRTCGHVVGMTVASEATLCAEYALPYAGICGIDNFCNGIAEVPLTIEEIIEKGRYSMLTFETIIRALITQGLE